MTLIQPQLTWIQIQMALGPDFIDTSLDGIDTSNERLDAVSKFNLIQRDVLSIAIDIIAIARDGFLHSESLRLTNALDPSKHDICTAKWNWYSHIQH